MRGAAMRPIDAIKYSENLVWMIGHGEFSSPLDALRRALYDLAQTPTLTLDDLRPKGRWNPLPEDDREQMVGDQCSLCGYEYLGSHFNFCPSCGADMRGSAND